MNRTTSYGADRPLVAFWVFICSPPAFVASYLLIEAPTNANMLHFAWTLAFLLLPIAVVGGSSPLSTHCGH